MTFAITPSCCNDAACVAVCPVQCIRPRPGDADFVSAEQLYIDPDSCIDCGACEPACPVDAIVSDFDLDLDDVVLSLNADYFDSPTGEEAAPPLVRRSLPAGVETLSVAIVGAGPAACYAATALTAIKGVEVTLVDRLPSPYGLVRYGVAPDHPATKQAGDRFAALLEHPRVRCLFNVEVGRDLSLDELAASHHAVIWAAGAEAPSVPDIEGRDLPGVWTAFDLVRWYNGHPDASGHGPELSGAHVVVIGNGNVALDVARVLGRPADALASTDVSDAALTVLHTSAVERILVAARRGPLDAACSLGELLRLTELDDLSVGSHEPMGPVDADVLAVRYPDGVPALAQRKLDLWAGLPHEGTLRFGFDLEPVAFTGADRVEAVRFARTRTVVEDGRTTTERTGEIVEVPADLVVLSTGFRTPAVEGLRIADDGRSLRTDHDGRLVDDGGAPMSGRYASGWARRGPSGVIGSNNHDASQVVDCILADLADGVLPEPSEDRTTLADRVADAGVAVVDGPGWSRVAAHEHEQGRIAGRPRVKVTTRQEMLALARPAPA